MNRDAAIKEARRIAQTLLKAQQEGERKTFYKATTAYRKNGGDVNDLLDLTGNGRATGKEKRFIKAAFKEAVYLESKAQEEAQQRQEARALKQTVSSFLDAQPEGEKHTWRSARKALKEDGKDPKELMDLDGDGRTSWKEQRAVRRAFEEAAKDENKAEKARQRQIARAEKEDKKHRSSTRKSIRTHQQRDHNDKDGQDSSRGQDNVRKDSSPKKQEEEFKDLKTLNDLDKDNDKRLDRFEFVRAARANLDGVKKVFDKNKDGTISGKEIASSLKDSGIKMTGIDQAIRNGDDYESHKKAGTVDEYKLLVQARTLGRELKEGGVDIDLGDIKNIQSFKPTEIAAAAPQTDTSKGRIS